MNHNFHSLHPLKAFHNKGYRNIEGIDMLVEGYCNNLNFLLESNLDSQVECMKHLEFGRLRMMAEADIVAVPNHQLFATSMLAVGQCTDSDYSHNHLLALGMQTLLQVRFRSQTSVNNLFAINIITDPPIKNFDLRHIIKAPKFTISKIIYSERVDINLMLRQILKKNFYYCGSQKFMEKEARKFKNFPEFTHFASVPFIREEHRSTLGFFQDRIQQIFHEHKLGHTLKRANTDLMHITLSMLTLNLQQYREKTVQVVQSIEKQVTETLKGVSFKLGDVKYFKKYDRKDKKEYVSLFYFDILRDESAQKLDKVTDLLIREMIKAEVIEPSELKSMHIRYDHRKGMYMNDAYHMTLFRIQGLSEDVQFQEAFTRVQEIKKQKELDLSFTCDFIDVSTRSNYDETKFYLPLARVQILNKTQSPPL